MRKRLITPSPQDAAAHDEGWLDLDRLAVDEVTSEDKDYPVESYWGQSCDVIFSAFPAMSCRPRNVITFSNLLYAERGA